MVEVEKGFRNIDETTGDFSRLRAYPSNWQVKSHWNYDEKQDLSF